MKNIVLLNEIFNVIRISEPIGVAFLATKLQAEGYENVEIVDPCVDGNSVGEMLEEVVNLEPYILGISSIESDPTYIIEFVQKFKRYNKNCVIVIGGHGPSLNPDLFLFEGIYSVIIGEGETSLTEFVNAVFEENDYRLVGGIKSHMKIS